MSSANSDETDTPLGASRENRITRRAAIVAAATLAASPALAAEQCRIGPEPHAKGPLVWMGLDQVELDAAYDQAVYAPLASQIVARWSTDSDVTRKRLGEPKRLAYGPTEIEKLDIYPTDRPNAPILVFIHGGAWRAGTARIYGYIAEPLVDAGAICVVLDFINVVEAGGDLGPMLEQVRRGIAWVYKNARSFGGDPERLFIAGHSSGGHLCGMALVTDWQGQLGLPVNTVKGGLVGSGMFDMKPVRLSKRSSYVRFDDAMEDAMSAMRRLDRIVCPVTVTHGSLETPEFIRQSREFAAALKALGKPVELIEAPGYNHFEICQTFGSPYGWNGRATLAMMGLGPKRG